MFFELQEREDRERRIARAKRLLEGKPIEIPRPRLVAALPSTKEMNRSPERGVYRDDLAPDGWSWFKIVTASGKVGIVHLPNELIDEMFAENLWRRLESKDPILKVI